MNLVWRKSWGFEADKANEHFDLFQDDESNPLMHLMFDGEFGVCSTDPIRLREGTMAFHMLILSREDVAFAFADPNAWWMEQLL